MKVTTKLVPPVAKKLPHTLEKHGHIRIDNYYWMNQRENPEVLEYLNQENAYNDAMTAHTQPLQEKLFEEMKSRIKLDDGSVPYKLDGYWYYVRFEEEGGYPLYCRRLDEPTASEEILFDNNAMAEEYDFFDMAGATISPDNNLAAFSVDTVGRRQYKIQIKNLVTGEIYPDSIENSDGNMAWANDNQTLFYVKRDEVTLRSDKVYKHKLGRPSSEDELVYEEKDESFSLSVFKSKSREYIFITAGSTLSDEFWFLDANKPEEDFQLFQKRIPDLEYEIEHFGNYFYILTNKDGATNAKLMKAPINETAVKNWMEVIPHRKDVLLEDVEIFEKYLVLSERITGLNKLRIMSWDGKEDYYLPFESKTYIATTEQNPEFNTPILRYIFTGLKNQTRVIAYDMERKEESVLKTYQVQDPSFNEDDYYAKRVWATAEDGKRIPISLVYKKGILLDGSNPLLLYGYGSYGVTVDPNFSFSRLSLLNRGFIYAIAHVRGGEYLGRDWYDHGKMEFKNNTFTDFIACSKYLIRQRYTSPQHLYAMGGSAGGLLMGAVMNQAPELYNGIVAQVPFVDVVTTMLDDSIPLTTGEYDEWGNPNNKKFYDLMLSYSPYDNVEAKAYPNLLVTTGFHDSQVQYWEPAKWVAKLRELKTDQNKLLFHINMDAGHSGASGRFEALKEVAEEFAFLLDLEGIKE